ncbi:hypothetical protein [Nocardioides alkalitolerans]|uniref:hypothetical protein n=1 Tax=Nocardioides alkalitolerans TaxID=281714 RepID=UPI00040E3E82|nr:hypothetical protein [Nocardioides alkalitolerans]
MSPHPDASRPAPPDAPEPGAPGAAVAPEGRLRLAPWAGLVVAALLVAAAMLVPVVFDWQVWARSERAQVSGQFPPLHGFWDPKVGIGTVPAVVLAVGALLWSFRLAERLPWRWLLVAAYVAGLAWIVALALVDGEHGLTRKLGADDEYLPTARATDDIGAFLTGFVDRIPADSEGQWPTHVAGHPPAITLFFVVLVRLGLGGDLAAAVVVVLLAASLALAVLVTLRVLGAEGAARRAAPFLVMTPAAVFLGVSGDAVIAVTVAWGIAALAAGAVTTRWGPRIVWSGLAGVLLGLGVLMSYGMPLIGLVCVAVLVLARSWWPLPIAAASALVVVLVFAAGGFAWWEAYPVLVERYWHGIASLRPASYWLWGNLAALLLSAGLLVGAGAGAWGARVVEVVRARRGGGATEDTPRTRPDRDLVVLLWLAGAGFACVLAADASRMSKAEVERIWLPFIPWLTLSLALLPRRWRVPGLALQLVGALVLQHLLYTSW